MQQISYIVSFISTVLGLCEPFGKKMKTILMFNFLGNLLVGISYLLVSSFSGTAICFVACVQVIINYLFNIQGKMLPKLLVAFHVVGFLGVNILTFRNWYDVLALAASLLFVLSVAQNNTKYYRFLFASNSMLWILYDLLSKSYGNLFTHVVLFAATLLAMVVHDFRRDRQEIK